MNPIGKVTPHTLYKKLVLNPLILSTKMNGKNWNDCTYNEEKNGLPLRKEWGNIKSNQNCHVEQQPVWSQQKNQQTDW